MRKLRKGERYALWRDLANTLNKVKRLPRHCVPRNDDYNKSIMPSNGRSLLRCAHRDDVESGRNEQVKVDLSKSYRPFKAIYKGNYNSSRTLFSLLMIYFCVLFSDAQAQSAGERAAEGLNKIKPLEIGDRVPEELWDLPLPVVNHPDGKDTITLKDYQNKVIVLDFLHSQCKSCIENLAKIKQLQSQLKDSVSFLILTKQRSENLFKTLNKEIIFSSALPWSYSATPIAAYFPYRIVSHYVIIKNGKVRAITGTSNITYDKLFSVLEGLPADFELKYDY